MQLSSKELFSTVAAERQKKRWLPSAVGIVMQCYEKLSFWLV